ncbi:MAG: glycosyltransferase family 4 protein [Planctomycetes bacterium]|nr:glycosyltransferase family 4 protein [Planctomycetota bacterium]
MRVVYSIGSRLAGGGIGNTAYHAARGIWQAGCLERLLCLGHEPSDIPTELIRSTWFPSRRFLRLPAYTYWRLKDWAYDRWAARQLPESFEVFHGWNSHCLATLGRARARGAVSFVERGSAHAAVQARLLEEESERFGLPKPAGMGRLVERCLAEYEIADFVHVPSSFCRQSFIEMGFPEHKVVQSPYGVDLARFNPQAGGLCHHPEAGGGWHRHLACDPQAGGLCHHPEAGGGWHRHLACDPQAGGLCHHPQAGGGWHRHLACDPQAGGLCHHPEAGGGWHRHLACDPQAGGLCHRPQAGGGWHRHLACDPQAGGLCHHPEAGGGWHRHLACDPQAGGLCHRPQAGGGWHRHLACDPQAGGLCHRPQAGGGWHRHLACDPQAGGLCHRFTVLFVGEIGLRKGALDLLEAWARVGLGDSRLVLCGGIEPAIARRVDDFRRRCAFETPGFARDMPAVYAAASVLVLPAIEDGFPLVVLEAMASGRPVVVSENTGSKDAVVEGESGFVVPIRSPDAIAEKLQWLHDHPAELAAMGAAARREAESYPWERHGRDLVEVYSTVAEGARKQVK